MATVQKSDKSFIVALGPLKVEVIRFSATGATDSVVSKLASPSFATIQGTEGTGTAANATATVNGKTINFANLTASGQYVCLVFGDSVWS